MSIPSTWTVAWAGSVGSGAENRGRAYETRYHAPAGTTLLVAEAALPYGTYYGGESGVWGSRLRYVTAAVDEPTKQVLVTYRYEPPTVEEVLVAYQDHIQVDARGSSVAYRAPIDLDGAWVWHTEREEANSLSKKYEPVFGSGLREEGRTLFRVRLCKAYDFAQWLVGYEGTVNGAMYLQYANYKFPAGTLRFAQWARTRAPTTEQLWMYDVLIEGRSGLWNEETLVQEYELRTYQIPVRQPDGTLIEGQFRIDSDWYPTDYTYHARQYESAMWNLICGIYNW